MNTRLLNIALPPEKGTAWTAGIKTIQKNRTRVTSNDLKNIIGKLNHVCFVVPDNRHFMDNLHRMETLVKFKKKVKLS